LRELPVIGNALAATGRGGTLFSLRMAANRTLLIVVAVLLGTLLSFALAPLYAFLADRLPSLAAGFSPEMLAMFGGGDLSSAAGFLHLETMGMVAPAGIIIIAVAYATAGIAGEEKLRRLPLLLAPPVSRHRIYGTSAATMALGVVIAAAALFAGMAAGIAVADLDVEFSHLAQSMGMLVLLGWFFGALALALSGATGRSGATVWISTGVAVVTYFGATLTAAAGRAEWAWWSPWRAYLHGPPLMEGAEWWQPVWLTVGAVVALAAGLPLFLRRDLG